MRTFRDSAGNPWDVVVGRESWGTVVAIFVPRTGPGLPKQALLDAASTDDGNRLLMSMDEGKLQSLLGVSTPKKS